MSCKRVRLDLVRSRLSPQFLLRSPEPGRSQQKRLSAWRNRLYSSRTVALKRTRESVHWISKSLGLLRRVVVSLLRLRLARSSSLVFSRHVVGIREGRRIALIKERAAVHLPFPDDVTPSARSGREVSH